MEKAVEYILFFFFYSIIGWISEVIYCSIKDKKFTNRGFLFGPICPIYGTGAISMLLALSWCKKWPVVVFLLGVVVCDIVEYLTSVIMEKLFHARWWDYSKKKFNLHGRICLEHSCYWGIFSVLLIYLIHPLGAAKLALLVPYEWKVRIMLVVLTLFAVDLIRALKNALDVKKISDKFKTVKDKVLQSFKEASFSSVKEDISSQINDLKKLLEEKTVKYKGKRKRRNRMLKNNPNLIESLKEQIEKLEKLFSEKFK